MTYMEKYGKGIVSVDYHNVDVETEQIIACVTYTDGTTIMLTTAREIELIRKQVQAQIAALDNGEIIPITR